MQPECQSQIANLSVCVPQLDTDHECDRQTDRQTDCQNVYSVYRKHKSQVITKTERGCVQIGLTIIAKNLGLFGGIICLMFNPLECKGNYIATLNNMSWYTGRYV